MRFLPLPDRPKVWILDFDGVVVESNEIKKNAHDLVLNPYPEELRRAAKPLIDDTSLNRHEKYLRIAREIFHSENPEAQAHEWVGRYRDLTRDAVIACPLKAGVESFFEAREDDGVPCYLASATPEDELLVILKARGIQGWFREAWGTPTRKPELLARAIAMEGIRREDSIFIGDSVTDLRASLEAGVPFLAMRGASDFVEEIRMGLSRIDDFRGLIE